MSALYAIRRKSDHRLMPHGGSWAEFDRYGEPRLFIKASSAKKALSAWLAGQWQKDSRWDGIPSPRKPQEYDPATGAYVPRIRIREHYEIVEVQLLVRPI